jgi:hypothetical protein
MRRLVVALIAAGLLATGCSQTVPGSGTRGAGQQAVTPQAATRYGAAPQPNPDVTYQSDVVIIAGGGSAIHGVEHGGLTWYLDPNAGGVSELAVGKVMFVTGRSVGRVVKIDEDGPDKIVTVVPVPFTDVIEDGHFAGSGPVSLSAPATYQADDAYSVPGSAGGSQPTPQPTPSGTHSIAGVFSAAPTWPQPKLGGSASAQAGGVNVSASCCSGGATVRFGYDGAGVRFAGSVTLQMQKPSAVFDIDIQNGKVAYARLGISGGVGLKVDIAGATRVFHNVDKIIPIPTDFSVPFANLLGVPLSASVSQLLFVHTAFSSKDGNISAHGEWGISGGLGFTYSGGEFTAQAPHALHKKTSITDSLQGISTGVSSIAVGYNVKVTVGIGAFGFTAGPYFELDLLVNLARGSALGAPITVCNSAQVTIFASYGIGYHIPKVTADLINFFLEKFGSRPIKTDGGVSGGQTTFSKIAYDPDTKICHEK